MVALDLVAMRAFLDEPGLERLEHRMELVGGGFAKSGALALFLRACAGSGAEWPDAVEAQLAAGHELFEFCLLGEALVDEAVRLAELLAEC